MGNLVVEVFKAVLRPQIAVVIAVSLCLIRFLPISELDNFRTEYKSYFSPAAIFCFVIAIVAWLIEKKKEWDALIHLKSLSPGERSLLRQAVKEKESVFTDSHQFGDGESLVLKGLATPVPHTPTNSKKYLIKPFVWKHFVNKQRKGLSGFEN